MKANQGKPQVKITDIFQGIADRMLSDFEKVSAQIPHAGERGAQREEALRKFLARYLPKKYAVGKGHVINTSNETSRECDIVIYDAFNCPLLLAEEDYQIFPVEAVFAVIEVKSVLNSKTLAECVENIRAVKTLCPSKCIVGSVFAYHSSYRSKPSVERTAESLQPLNSRVPPGERIDLLVVLDDGVITSEPGFGSTSELNMHIFIELTTTILLFFLYRLLQLMEHSPSSMPELVLYATGGEIGLVREAAQSTSEVSVD
jgi:hypothetical protein